MRQATVWTARGIGLAYWVGLSLLILVPNPWTLLGFVRAPAQAPDLGVHFVAFVVLGFCTVMSRLPIRRRTVFVILTTYAVLIELAQFYFPPRTVELRDFIENLLGLSFGILLAGLLQTTWQRRNTCAPRSEPAES